MKKVYIFEKVLTDYRDGSITVIADSKLDAINVARISFPNEAGLTTDNMTVLNLDVEKSKVVSFVYGSM